MINDKFVSEAFINGVITPRVRDIPIGIYDANGTFTATDSFEFQNTQLHTWNIEIFLKLHQNADIYFNDDTDYLVVTDINTTSCGFLFDDHFDEKINDMVLFNDQKKSKFDMIDGTYVYDNRIIIITNSNFNDIFKLSYYCKKLTISPFRLNVEQSPYQLLKNYIFFTLPIRTTQPKNKEQQISGGLIRCNSVGFHEHLYEYDITAFYPNIIMKYLDESEPVRILMQPLMNDSLKCLKLYVYGMLGNRYSILYNPRVMDFITSTGRTIIAKYSNRAAIIATDAIFMTYPIIPDFCGLSYKTIVHDNVFVISASQYFTDQLYRGFPKNVLSELVCHLLAKFILHPCVHDNATMALIEFMKTLKSFPLFPIPLKCGRYIMAPLRHSNCTLDDTWVDKYGYLIKYRKAIYRVCQHKSTNKHIQYDSFKRIYGYFSYMTKP